jgi:hypothetical protein
MHDDIYIIEFKYTMFLLKNVKVYLINNLAPEPEGLSLHSKEPATGSCPEPVESTKHPPPNLPKIHSDPIYTLVF